MMNQITRFCEDCKFRDGHKFCVTCRETLDKPDFKREPTPCNMTTVTDEEAHTASLAQRVNQLRGLLDANVAVSNEYAGEIDRLNAVMAQKDETIFSQSLKIEWHTKAITAFEAKLEREQKYAAQLSGGVSMLQADCLRLMLVLAERKS